MFCVATFAWKWLVQRCAGSQTDMKSIVFFGAHPDDVELGAGGTCAKLCAQGYDVHIVIVAQEADRATAMARRDEQIAAGTCLGVRANKIHFLGFPDGRVHCNKNTVRAMRCLFKQMGIAPIAVFTHTEFDSHNDHVETTKLVKSTFRDVTILKYQVQNSAFRTGFSPNIYCAVDAFVAAKNAALLEHKTQVSAGRVSIPMIEKFSRRFAVHAHSQFCEAFEADVQEGATTAWSLLSALNSSAFARFWTPILSQDGLTVVAGSRHHKISSIRGLLQDHVESELQLITRLQARLLGSLPARLAGASFPTIDVVESNGVGDDAFFRKGNVLVVGGPAVNPAASRVLNNIRGLRYRMDHTSADRHDLGVFDNHTGKVLRAAYGAGEDESSGIEVLSDYGLLTLAINPFSPKGKGTRYIIGAMGIHASGVKAALDCVMDPKHIGEIIDDAQSVFQDGVPTAQWLIRCNGLGAGFGSRNISAFKLNSPPEAVPAHLLVHSVA